MNLRETERALERLSVLADSRSRLTDEMTHLVLMLRSPDFEGGCAASWQDVAGALKVSRQAAWRMYRAVDDGD